MTVTALAGAVLALTHSGHAYSALPAAGARGAISCAVSMRPNAGATCAARRFLTAPPSLAAASGLFSVRDSDMSSTLRLLIVMVLLLATGALGLIAYNAYLPKPVAPVAQNAPAPAPASAGYLVAARPLPAGTLARDEDFAVRSGDAPSGAILDTPAARAGLRGSLVRTFLDMDAPVTADDVLRPRDRGFLASVLAPDTRAVSINVDAESGVSGLIWPGDNVDVVLTQTNDKADAAHRALSETVLRNVRIIAIDQDIVQGAAVNNAIPGTANSAAVGKEARSVSLQLSPEQVKKITVAKDLGKLSLAVRSAVEQRDTGNSGTMFSCDVSPEIARQSEIANQNTTVVVYTGETVKEYSVKKLDARKATAAFGCEASGELAGRGDALADLRGR